jgi:hypothetical protein
MIPNSQPRIRLKQSQYPQLSESENTLPRQEAHRKSGSQPTIVMTSTTNLIQLKMDFKEHVKENTSSETHEMEPVS